MTNPIIPPPELVQQLWDKLRKAPDANVDAAIAWTQAITEAAQWGYQQAVEELEAFLRKDHDKS